MGSEVGSRGSQPGQRLYYESQQQLIRKGYIFLDIEKR